MTEKVTETLDFEIALEYLRIGWTLYSALLTPDSKGFVYSFKWNLGGPEKLPESTQPVKLTWGT